jgi:hypothetical protein
MRTDRAENDEVDQVNEKQIARLFGLALGGLLTAGLVLNAMAL